MSTNEHVYEMNTADCVDVFNMQMDRHVQHNMHNSMKFFKNN
jgi:hypothetical protein